MGQNLTKFLTSIFAPKAVSDILDNQDPKELGSDLGKGLKRAILAQISPKAYLAMSGKLVAWVDNFYISFRKELNE